MTGVQTCALPILPHDLGWGEWGWVREREREKEERRKGDKKNIREQDIVRKYIERQLLPVCSKVEHGRLVTQTAGELSHLRTDFRFRPLKGTGLTELASRLHPTPAVCGLPKEEAQKFILSAETHDRAYYSGFAGPVDVEGTKIGRASCRERVSSPV